MKKFKLFLLGLLIIYPIIAMEITLSPYTKIVDNMCREWVSMFWALVITYIVFVILFFKYFKEK